jgi:hypothetical protein
MQAAGRRLNYKGISERKAEIMKVIDTAPAALDVHVGDDLAIGNRADIPVIPAPPPRPYGFGIAGGLNLEPIYCRLLASGKTRKYTKAA